MFSGLPVHVYIYVHVHVWKEQKQLCTYRKDTQSTLSLVGRMMEEDTGNLARLALKLYVHVCAHKAVLSYIHVYSTVCNALYVHVHNHISETHQR